jgi:D-alanyl-D-alanine carboxypeptidase (penicillin-binding protein 5/6)
MTSSNDGAHSLASVIGYVKQDESKTARELFIEEMNKKTQEIGLAQTYFLNESGLDMNEEISGAYGSAKDMAFLMGHIIENNAKILEATRYSELKINSKNLIYDAENTNQYAESIPGILGSKTGFTDLAGGNLVVGFDLGINHPIIVSVLGSTREGRFKDVNKLVKATINKFKK